MAAAGCAALRSAMTGCACFSSSSCDEDDMHEPKMLASRPFRFFLRSTAGCWVFAAPGAELPAAGLTTAAAAALGAPAAAGGCCPIRDASSVIGAFAEDNAALSVANVSFEAAPPTPAAGVVSGKEVEAEGAVVV